MRTALALLLSVLLLSSCEYKDLCYDHNHEENYNVILKLLLKLELGLELDLEVSEEDHTKIIAPEYMKVCFYGSEDGKLKNTEFVTGEGGPLHTAPGTYDMVVYSFGTEYIQIRGEGDVNTLEAFTSDITATKAHALSVFTRAGVSTPPTTCWWHIRTL